MPDAFFQPKNKQPKKISKPLKLLILEAFLISEDKFLSVFDAD